VTRSPTPRDEDCREQFQGRPERGDDDERENAERAESSQLARESLVAPYVWQMLRAERLA
jgi:hypothetical protein